MDAAFKGAVRKFWASLKTRHRGGNALKYGPIAFDRDQFAAWLWEKSHEGVTWECEYTGNTLQLMAKTQAGRLTIDHKVPLAQGGRTELSNLACCSEEANRIKGDMSLGCYLRLMTTLHPELPGDRESVLKRLKGYNPSWRKRA